jgi:uncharacterized protein YjiS (DUF1127 family)
MVSASFKYSNFDIYCTESNVLLAPRIVSDQSARVNQITPGIAQSSAVDGHAMALDKRLRQRRRIARSNDWRPEMSATLSTPIRLAVAKRTGAFSRLFSACLDGIARHFVRRAAIACLRELDDRALRDIGLVQSQIEAAVHGRRALTGEAASWS